MEQDKIVEVLIRLEQKVEDQTRILNKMDSEIIGIRDWKHNVISPLVQKHEGRLDEITGANGSVSLLRTAVTAISKDVNELKTFMTKATTAVAIIVGICSAFPSVLGLIKSIHG